MGCLCFNDFIRIGFVMKVENKRVIITGSANGIGSSLSHAFRQKKSHVGLEPTTLRLEV